jgi:hypothetical protein
MNEAKYIGYAEIGIADIFNVASHKGCPFWKG